jgi:hypothetical protein
MKKKGQKFRRYDITKLENPQTFKEFRISMLLFYFLKNPLQPHFNLQENTMF